MNETEMVERIRAHALRNYEQGWDVLVECWDDGDILEVVSDSQTSEWPSFEAALARIAKSLGVEVNPPTSGWEVATRDVDGSSRRYFKTESEAINRFTEMVGREMRLDEGVAFAERGYASAVSSFGTVVAIKRLG